MITEQFFMLAFSLKSNDQLAQLFHQSHILFLFQKSHLLPFNVVFFCNLKTRRIPAPVCLLKWHPHPFIVFRSTESIYENGNQGIIWKLKNMAQQERANDTNAEAWQFSKHLETKL